VHVDDLARLCLRLGGRDDDVLLDAVGPQSMTFREMITSIRAAVGSRAVVIPVPGSLVPPLSAALGLVLRDVLLTREEYRAMAEGLADSDGPATGETAFTDWVAQHGADLGRSYANELDLHFRPAAPAGPPLAKGAR
jgi:NADH dehydrogenase